VHESRVVRSDGMVWLPSAKLRPPPALARIVERPVLLRRLTTGLECRLSLLQAPAGFGKTTLLARWLEHLRLRGVPAAWLNLDEDDRDPQRFLAHLGASLARAGILAEASRSVAPTPRAGLAALVHALEAGPARAVVLLDGYERAAGPELDALLTVALRLLPEGVHLALASRVRPGLPLGDLRAHGLITCIGPDALRFGPGETGQLFDAALDQRGIEALLARSEGWPVALQLAHQARPAGPVPEPQRLWQAAWPLVEDYVSEAILAPLPAELQDFLRATAELEAICAELADELRGAGDSLSLMRRLEVLDGLVMALDPERRWVRVNPLLRKALQRRAAELGAEPVRAGHATAARWFAARGDLAAAVRHARAAQDLRLAATLVEEAGGVGIFLTRGLALLAELLGSLPAEAVHASPRLEVARALLVAKAGRLVEARRRLEEVRGLLAARPPDPALLRDVELVHQLLVTYEDGGVTRAEVEALEAQAARAAGAEHWYQGCLQNMLCIRHVHRGNLAAARTAAQRAMVQFADAGAAYGRVFMGVHVGLIRSLQARSRAAFEALTEARELARTHFPHDAALGAVVDVVLAEALYARGDLEPAGELLGPALPVVERHEGWTEVFWRGYATDAGLALARAGPAAALQRLERAVEVADQRGLWRLRWLVAAERVRLLTRAGDLERAADGAARLAQDLARERAPEGGRLSWRERTTGGLVLARLAVQRGEPAAALERLEEVRREGERTGARFVLLQTEALHALAAAAAGHEDEALGWLRRALAQAVPEGLRRPLADEGGSMAALLRRAVRLIGVNALPAPTVAFIADVLSAIEGVGERGGLGARASSSSISASATSASPAPSS